MSAPTTDFAGLYVSEKSRLTRLVQRFVRNRATTEELVHDAFVNLIDRGASARDQKAYLTRIARNLAIDSCRADRHLQSLDEVDLFAMADPSPSAEAALLDREALALTLRVLAALPERTRAAFVLHRLGELTLADIAGRLGMSTAHAGRLVLQGYVAVRDALRAAELR